MAVRIPDDPTPILYIGNTNSLLNLEGRLENIPLNLESMISEGTSIISSSITSDCFDNAKIGTIKNIQPNPNGMFLSADVQLDNALQNLEEVIILKRTE